MPTRRSTAAAEGTLRTRTLAAVAALVSVVVAWLAAEPFANEAIPAPSARGAASTSGSGEARLAAAAASTMERRVAVAAVDPRRGESAATTTKGRVVDLAGKGIAGVPVGHEAPAGVVQVAASGRDGEFVGPQLAAGTWVVACDDRWETLAAARVGDAAGLVVVVAPRVSFAGRVIDGGGQPIEGALLSIDVPSMDAGGDVACITQWLACSEQDGSFTFDAAPSITTARLRTQHPGHRSDARAAPGAAQSVTIVMEALPVAEPVRGTVFGPDGVPIANARVRMGDTNATSVADGTFALDASREAAGTKLFVVAAGRAPVALDDPRPGDGRTPSPVVVSMQDEVAITGRLVDASGTPLPEWTVVLADPTPRDPRRPFAPFVEGELGPLRVVTDDAGHFTIGGVFARRYTVEAWDRRGERGLRAAIAPADGFATLVARELGDATTLRGIVVDGDGRPVAGVLVGEQRPGCLASGALAMRFDHRVTTGADGRFELPRRGAALHLVVDGAAIVPRCIPLPAAIGDAPLRLEVARRRDVFTGEGAQGFALEPVDGGGESLPACEPSPGAFGVPTTTRGFVVRHRGVRVGTLPIPANDAPLRFRVQPGSR